MSGMISECIHVLIDKISSLPLRWCYAVLNEACVHIHTYVFVYSRERNNPIFIGEGSMWAGWETSHRERPGGDKAQEEGFRARQGEAEATERHQQEGRQTQRRCVHTRASMLVYVTLCQTQEVIAQYSEATCP